MSSAIPSRTRILSCYGLWLVLAATTACIDSQEVKKASQPPPIVGSGSRANATRAQAAVGDSASNAGAAGVRSGMATRVGSGLATDGGTRPTFDAAEADLDAGPMSAGTGAAGASAGRGGSSGAFAAGSGGRAGTGGRGGAGGQGGAAGGMPPNAACMDQLCFTLVDCWLLSPTDCNYVACENFVCR